MGTGVRLMIARNALRVSVSEAVDRLIHISNDCHGSISSQETYQLLLRPVEVLIFIHDDMVEAVSRLASWIVPKVSKRLRDQLANEHRFVKSQPTHQLC